MTKETKPTQKDKKRDKPVNLSESSFDEVLAALLKTKSPPLAGTFGMDNIN
jgi:hypothetical protein